MAMLPLEGAACSPLNAAPVAVDVDGALIRAGLADAKV